MKIVNEPRYQDFNGKVHKTEQECIHAEDVFVHKVFRILDELATGCEKCYIEKKIGNLPYTWHIEEEE